MNKSNQVLAKKPLTASLLSQGRISDLPRRSVFGALAVVVCFSLPLYKWVRFALQSELYSYTLLVPFIAVYLFGLIRKDRSHISATSFRGVALFSIVSGAVALGCYWFVTLADVELAPQDSVALTTFSFVLLLSGVCAWWMNPEQTNRALFPLGFLLFMVPFPVTMEHAIEAFLQHGSAPPASWLFQIAGTSLHQHDLVFQLPGMTLEIAPECSGIRSTVVLFITSVLAGHLFLSSPWKRAVLTGLVIPLALLRNGFRIFTIGELCVHVGPHMIHSPIHHRGGPIFFALSLIPFSILLFFLVKSDRSITKRKP